MSVGSATCEASPTDCKDQRNKTPCISIENLPCLDCMHGIRYQSGSGSLRSTVADRSLHHVDRNEL